MPLYSSRKVLEVSSDNHNQSDVLLEGLDHSIPIAVNATYHNTVAGMLTQALTTNTSVSVQTNFNNGSERVMKVILELKPLKTEPTKTKFSQEKLVNN